MTYPTATLTTIPPVERYIDANLIQSTSFINRHILARGAYLVLAPASFIPTAIDAIIGLGAAIGAFCTLGMHKPTFRVAIIYLFNAGRCVACPYEFILRALNPKVIVEESTDGFIAKRIADPLLYFGKACSNSDNFLKRHVTSRLTYALLALSYLVARVVDGVIGILAAGFSIVTVGKFTSLNNLAFRALHAPCILKDLFFCIIKIMNPWASTQ